MTNATIQKFEYPDSLLHEYDNWVVLLRPDQVTLGSMILACKGEVSRVSDVSEPAFAELAVVTRDMEAALRNLFRYDKINYLLLMMVDNHVHFHVLPRYSTSREACGFTFEDPAWPGPPDLSKVTAIDADIRARLLQLLRGSWRTSA